MTSLRAATVQFHHRAGDKDYNLAVINNFARQARDLRVKMLARSRDVHHWLLAPSATSIARVSRSSPNLSRWGHRWSD